MEPRDIQTALNAAGFGPLKVDGDIGKATTDAVKAFQVAKGITVAGDAGYGTVGPKTSAALAAFLGASAPVSAPVATPPIATGGGLKWPDFKGPAKKLEDIDLPRIARAIACGEDEVHMLMDVETSGSGFDSQGRPKILFEPHKFWIELGPGPLRDKAAAQGLAYPKWGMQPYPKESYTRLFAAIALDRDDGLRSASWGAAQIMGGNHKLAGFANVVDFVNAMCEDEDNHIEAMIEFVKASGIDDDLRRLAALTRPTTPDDCRIIARTYNGSGYESNGYHIKMANAHNKWRGIKDTPYTE